MPSLRSAALPSSRTSSHTRKACSSFAVQHPALRTGTQKHVAVADKYYAFTRETAGERLLIVFHNADAPETLNLDLTGTSIADAKSLTSIFGPSTAQLQDGHLNLKLAPYSLTVYQVK